MKPLSLYYSNASTMDIEATKLELIQLLLNTQKEHVLVRLKEVFEQEEDVDFWDELPANLKASIEHGLSQSADGQVKSHEEVMQKYQQRL